MKKLLFVCTGNTCRSPMAEAVMKVLASAHGLTGWEIASAGVMAAAGTPASWAAMQAVAEIGGDLTDFKSSQLTAAMAAEADLIVVMTASHRNEVVRRWPGTAGKVHLLLEYTPDSGNNVADPFGGSLDLYRYTLAAMLPALNSLLEQILNSKQN